MVIRLVVRVNMEDMKSVVIYPRDEEKEERAALLTGIVQLVSTALKRDDSLVDLSCENFMKSDRGVIGYVQTKSKALYICEADNEGEAGDVLRAIIKANGTSDEHIADDIEQITKRRGREISSLWG